MREPHVRAPDDLGLAGGVREHEPVDLDVGGGRDDAEPVAAGDGDAADGLRDDADRSPRRALHLDDDRRTRVIGTVLDRDDITRPRRIDT